MRSAKIKRIISSIRRLEKQRVLYTVGEDRATGLLENDFAIKAKTLKVVHGMF